MLHACFPLFFARQNLVLSRSCIPWYTFVAFIYSRLREVGSGISISFIYLCCALCFSSYLDVTFTINELVGSNHDHFQKAALRMKKKIEKKKSCNRVAVPNTNPVTLWFV